MNINNIIDRQFEDKSLRELIDSPVSALQGITEADAQHLKDAFNIKTIGDLGRNKVFRAAVSIVMLAEREAEVIKK